MKQISSFMSEISDEFKTIVVEAIRSVCVKFPRKHHILMTFLSSMLREEGGFEYKKAIVDTIIIIIEENADAKESGLTCTDTLTHTAHCTHTARTLHTAHTAHSHCALHTHCTLHTVHTHCEGYLQVGLPQVADLLNTLLQQTLCAYLYRCSNLLTRAF